MTDNDSGDQPIPSTDPSDEKSKSRGHRRAVAREKAQLARQRQKRRARGLRWGLTGGIGVVVVAAVAVVVVLVVQSIQPAGPGPQNMASDGITIGKGFKAIQTDALQASEQPTATTTTAASDTVNIVVYLDYLCPQCGSFEKTNNEYIRGLVKSGAATVEFHPVSLLTNQSLGTKYSQRAANAAACVANYSPDAFFDFNSAMFAKQPEQRTAGLTDPQIISLIKDVPGIEQTSEITKCVNDKKFQSWVVNATQRALDGPLPNTSVKKLVSAPMILVNGQQYKYTVPFTTDEFSNFVVTAAGNSYADNATETPSPTPTTRK
jgi:protein-disulfide isomerase